jgi:hypothetical protein
MLGNPGSSSIFKPSARAIGAVRKEMAKIKAATTASFNLIKVPCAAGGPAIAA